MGEQTHELSKTKLLGAEPQPELVRLFSNETQVTKNTPPAFLAHARDDTDVPPDNSRRFVAALQANRVPVEYGPFQKNCNFFSIFRSGKGNNPFWPKRPPGGCTRGVCPLFLSVRYFDSVAVLLR